MNVMTKLEIIQQDVKSLDRDESLKDQDWSQSEQDESKQDESTNSDSTTSSKSSVECNEFRTI